MPIYKKINYNDLKISYSLGLQKIVKLTNFQTISEYFLIYHILSYMINYHIISYYYHKRILLVDKTTMVFNILSACKLHEQIVFVKLDHVIKLKN